MKARVNALDDLARELLLDDASGADRLGLARNSSSKCDFGDLAKVQDAAPVTRSNSASEVVPSLNHRAPSERRLRTFARVHASRSTGSPARSWIRRLKDSSISMSS
jgi:hypothetical protein